MDGGILRPFPIEGALNPGTVIAVCIDGEAIQRPDKENENDGPLREADDGKDGRAKPGSIRSCELQ